MRRPKTCLLVAFLEVRLGVSCTLRSSAKRFLGAAYPLSTIYLVNFSLVLGSFGSL